MLTYMHGIVSFIAQYCIVIPPVVLTYLFIRSPRPLKINMLVLTLVSAIVTIVAIKIATTVHVDPRPFTHAGVVPYFKSSLDNGFPSDHTAFSALLGFIALHYSRRIGGALLLLSLVIGLSRVIANVHHLQDIAGGFAIAGISYAAIVYGIKTVERLNR